MKKNGLLLLGALATVGIALSGSGCGGSGAEKPDSTTKKPTATTSNPIADVQRKEGAEVEVATAGNALDKTVGQQPTAPAKVDTRDELKEKRDMWCTATGEGTRMMPTPGGMDPIARIPGGTRLAISETQHVQMGMINAPWYKVNYKGKSGWVSSFSTKEGENVTPTVTSVEEMERAYEAQIGPKPLQNPLTGTVDAVARFIKKNAYDAESVQFDQWYKVFLMGGAWHVRVEYRGRNAAGLPIKADETFRVDGKVVTLIK